MPGGLISLTSYGSQDLYLTGTPSITFFKAVYRRNTNFAIDSIKVRFDTPVEFGNCAVIKIPKIGDLMYKTFIEITLPEISLKRTTDKKLITKYTQKLKIATEEYNLICKYLELNRNSFIIAHNIYIAENGINITDDIIYHVNEQFNNNKQINNKKLKKIKEIFDFHYEKNLLFGFNECNLKNISKINKENKDKLYESLRITMDKLNKVHKYFHEKIIKYQEKLNESKNEFVKFAWVDRVGHAILESVEVQIGGTTIDQHYCGWLNIWYELTANRAMEPVYFEMIGNVPVLTNFDRCVKPRYILRVPLQFWFCRFSGLAIPLVALEYHDVTIHVKFRRFQELCYFEKGCDVEFCNLECLNASLLIDYIYLDDLERRKFAQFNHEYLIDQLQVLELCSVQVQHLQIELNNFVHPSKELVWVAQRQSFTVNLSGSHKCRWDNYSATKLGVINPIAYSGISFHCYERVPKLNGDYYNYVQPYETHHSTPSDGINVYSFALYPEEYQPSGSANMSTLDRVVISVCFDDCLVDNGIIYDPLNIAVFTRNINILRFASGFCGVAFVYG